MIIHVKQACEFKSASGDKYRCPNGFIGTPPEWVANNGFFKTLAAAGLITMHVDGKGVDVEVAKEDKKKGKS